MLDEVSDPHGATTEVIDVDDDQLRIPGIHAEYVNSHITWSKKLQQVRLRWGLAYVACDRLSNLGDVECVVMFRPNLGTRRWIHLICEVIDFFQKEKKSVHSVRISMADLYRLEPRQYLNDVLMDVAISKSKQA